jgi:hypothetical protein
MVGAGAGGPASGGQAQCITHCSCMRGLLQGSDQQTSWLYELTEAGGALSVLYVCANSCTIGQQRFGHSQSVAWVFQAPLDSVVRMCCADNTFGWSLEVSVLLVAMLSAKGTGHVATAALHHSTRAHQLAVGFAQACQPMMRHCPHPVFWKSFHCSNPHLWLEVVVVVVPAARQDGVTVTAVACLIVSCAGLC